MARYRLQTEIPRANMSLVSDHALAAKPVDRMERKARDRSERERRRVYVARWRWLEDHMTAVEIAAALSRLEPPIIVTSRTVERDFVAISTNARKYLSVANFDARFEVREAIDRHKLIARKSTRRALMGNDADAAKWARVTVQATEAMMALLQDVGLVDRHLGVLLVTDDDAPQTRIPNGAELADQWANVNVPDLVSLAERAWKYGDAAAAERAAREATVGVAVRMPNDGKAPL